MSQDTPGRSTGLSLGGSAQEEPSEGSLRELAFECMIERGLADSDAGRVISNEEMGRRIDEWTR